MPWPTKSNVFIRSGSPASSRTRIRGKQYFVAFILQSDCEPQPGIVLGGDNEPHPDPM